MQACQKARIETVACTYCIHHPNPGWWLKPLPGMGQAPGALSAQCELVGSGGGRQQSLGQGHRVSLQAHGIQVFVAHFHHHAFGQYGPCQQCILGPVTCHHGTHVDVYAGDDPALALRGQQFAPAMAIWRQQRQRPDMKDPCRQVAASNRSGPRQPRENQWQLLWMRMGWQP